MDSPQQCTVAPSAGGRVQRRGDTTRTEGSPRSRRRPVGSTSAPTMNGRRFASLCYQINGCASFFQISHRRVSGCMLLPIWSGACPRRPSGSSQ